MDKTTIVELIVIFWALIWTPFWINRWLHPKIKLSAQSKRVILAKLKDERMSYDVVRLCNSPHSISWNWATSEINKIDDKIKKLERMKNKG